MNKYKFDAGRIEQIEAIFLFYKSKGFEIALSQSYPSFAELVEIYWKNYPFILIRPEQRVISGVNRAGAKDYKDHKQLAFNEVFSCYIPHCEVVLNREYTAVVSAKGIQVGCQTFPLEVLDTLNEARKKVVERLDATKKVG